MIAFYYNKFSFTTNIYTTNGFSYGKINLVSKYKQFLSSYMSKDIFNIL